MLHVLKPERCGLQVVMCCTSGSSSTALCARNAHITLYDVTTWSWVNLVNPSTVCARAAVTVHFRKIVRFLHSHHVTISGQRMQCSIRTHVLLCLLAFDRRHGYSLYTLSLQIGCSRTGLLVCASCFACLFPLKMDYPNVPVAPVRVKWRRSSASFRPYGSKLGRALKRSCRLLAFRFAKVRMK